jgi:hypothetical protein
MSTNNIIVDRDKVYEKYMNMIEAMADECDWITNISPMTLINLVVDIIENEPNITNKK